MTNDHRERGKREARSDDEAALSARLRGLGERLSQVRDVRSQTNDAGRRETADTSAMARGLRLSAEMVGGVVVGAGLGWLMDRWLGTSPWGLSVFLMLGFAAGVLNVIRAAGLATGGVPDSTVDKRDAD